MSFDDLIEVSAQSSIFCRPWWLDAVAPGMWEYVTVESGGKTVAAMPVVRKGRNIVMPILTQTLGILFGPIKGSYPRVLSTKQTLSTEIIDQLPSFNCFSQNFHYSYTDWLPFYWRDFKQSTRYTYVIECIDPNRNWLGIRKGVRSEIKQARSRVEVREDIPLRDFHSICRLTYKKMERSYPRKTIERIDSACGERDARKIISALSKSGEIVGSIYLVGNSKSTYYLLSGSRLENEHPGVLALLLWEGIQATAGRSKSFDFEGSMVRNISDKFRRFGGVQKPYSYIWKDNYISSIKKRLRFFKPLLIR
jgi:hypothetical protein